MSYRRRAPTGAAASVIARADCHEEEGEDVDDVEVELDGAGDVILLAHLVLPAAHNLLRVVRQELSTTTKYTCTIDLLHTGRTSSV